MRSCAADLCLTMEPAACVAHCLHVIEDIYIICCDDMIRAAAGSAAFS